MKKKILKGNRVRKQILYNLIYQESLCPPLMTTIKMYGSKKKLNCLFNKVLTDNESLKMRGLDNIVLNKQV